ncbi:unnamed protein product [Effrenium voratum]|uniref:Uncharacterized protein n=1 Tax=Effrenium voratum TaxID=2562239 RepID=A0AA36JCM4_9DINO|nr:unnamed protein product [Effrenium voratum]CAJ1402855.1 unnamed protein product [Effrenium voratum]CAJ1428894.1 unnamed protein product [Effrenium voratum]|mmetsp:Transcript_77438/g.185619  ORF Transcript_77438/g.185619 Transcript_77438/m.185619 type:complete len:227 (-) Transcript_77438:69-749(-)|eukprot:CAMPEP_0181406816 /NCGR_PEP_ID=MMETSP1110-20121109/5464_1 /TAXON_ID=174948 /ORGANISM="Symbiodinium sp., Strain CCMP421" /LENGTH=226 /DNA_ID=CAMNT_0023529235 /DNA_START=10 /DNA_END=690 /DNA_ORIENTATION=+
MTSPSQSNESGDCRQTCTGVGWVTFDPDRQKQLAHQADGGAMAMPEVRCIGRSTAGDPRTEGWMQVDAHTWALICGGRLRTVHRPGDSEAELPLWQCEGVSFRIERMPPIQNPPAPKEAPEPQPNAQARHKEPEVEEADLEDILMGAARGAQAVASRARTIVTFWGSERKTPLAPGSFALDVAKASGKICAQAEKITRRSVEQAGQVVFFPFRFVGAWGAPKPQDE